MSTTLRLAQLNIEGSKHLDVVIPFLKTQEVEVWCVQELFQRDVERFEKEFGMTCVFAPMSAQDGDVRGVAVMSTHPIHPHSDERYGGALDGPMPVSYERGTIESKYNTQRFTLLMCDIEKDGQVLRVGTTHFPVTKHAEVTDFQRTDMRALIALLQDKGEFVLCGDLNTPRGGEIFSMLSERYIDNIPPEYTSTLDPVLHRAGPLEYVVDGYFSTLGLSVKNVTRYSGVSDHCALIGDVTLG